MDSREAFKVGFLAACADLDLDGPAAAQLMTKAADFLGGLPSAAAQNAGLMAIGAPVAAGLTGGWLASKLLHGDSDPEDVKTQEVIDEYLHWARRAREHQKNRALRVPAPVAASP